VATGLLAVVIVGGALAGPRAGAWRAYGFDLALWEQSDRRPRLAARFDSGNFCFDLRVNRRCYKAKLPLIRSAVQERSDPAAVDAPTAQIKSGSAPTASSAAAQSTPTITSAS